MIEISSINKVDLKFLNSGDYLFLDLDDTLIKVVECDGHFYNQLIDSGKTIAEATEIWCKGQVPERTRFADNYVNSLIFKASIQQIKIIICTARSETTKDLTLKQLDYVDLHYDDIIFCNMENKGEKIKEYLKNQDVNLIFVDDDFYNCQNVKAVFPNAKVYNYVCKVHQINTLEKVNISHLKKGDYLILDIDETMLIHQKGKLKVVDKYIYQLIEQARNKDLNIIACSSRPHKHLEKTFEHLILLKLSVDKVILTEALIDKGAAIYNYLRNKDDLNKHIVFVDDVKFNCLDVNDKINSARCYHFVK